MAVNGELPKLVELLKQSTSIRVVSEFLKKKDIAHSASSWKALEEDRLAPALDNGTLAFSELHDLLSESEEFGRCHVFLYQCSAEDAAAIVDPDNVRAIAQEANLMHALKNPVLTDLPSVPTITSIRSEVADGGTLSIKVVETRSYEEEVDEHVRDGRRIVEYEKKEARAVNVLRLSVTGVLEVRIQSHTKSLGSSYLDDIRRIWSGPLLRFFPQEKFEKRSIGDLKDDLWSRRKELTDLLRFSDLRMRDSHGFPLIASTPRAQSDLVSRPGMVKCIQEFLDSGAHSESSNLWWKQQDNGIPSTDIHVLLSGESNEFTFTANCTKADYEYVLAQFTRLGL